MKNLSEYQQAKNELRSFAENISNSDKPAKRMAINDQTDSIIKDNRWLKFSDKKQNQYFNWLSDFACTLHP